MVVKSFGLLAVAVIGFIGLGAALIWFVTQLVRGNQKSVVAVMPLIGEQQLRVESAGTFVILLEAPQLATGARDFQIDLTEQQSGQRTTLKLHYFGARTKISGVTTVKIPYGQVHASQPGSFVVQVSGLQPGKDYANYRLILSRPFLARMTFQIVGIVFCGVGMLLTVIWACWLMGLMTSSAPPQ